ncbi:hypothetical protein [Malaciobacter marinus]|uniref:hypothetical protein n=1 Tax=Malaciobacter marinus TaxID=505249 RepID=UPI003B003BF6
MKKLMQWTYFLDILGYGEEQKNIDNQEKANIFIEFMKGNKFLIDKQEHFDKHAYKDKIVNIYDYYDFKSVFISNSFVLTAIPKETLFNEEDYYNLSTFVVMELTFKILILLEHILTEKGLLIRGGISNKFTDIDEESSLAVGQGLIEAYKLESKFAKVPRVLLSEEISNDVKIMASFKEHSEKYGKNFNIFSKDKLDNLYYLDYLGYILSFLHKSENKRLDIQKRIEEKYAITEDIITGLNKLVIEEGAKDLSEKIIDYITKKKVSEQDFIKINKMLKESSEILTEIKDNIQNIQSIKYTTINTLSKLQEVINFNLEKYSTKKDILNKYIWLGDYLNKTIDDFSDIEFIQEYKITKR